jgi:dolichol-phosphate mannosyltransferase
VKIIVVIPTYNEAKNIEELVRRLLAVQESVQVLIVDDDSPDGTGKIADKLEKKYTGKVSVLHRKGKRGLGSAYIEGFQHVLKNMDADLIFSMDADFSHDPKYLPGFVDKIGQGFDLVVGSRYIKGGGMSWELYRRILSRGANLFAKNMLGFRINDLTGAFRCYKREVLASIPLGTIKSDGFSFLEEILFLCKEKRFRMGEIPIFFLERQKGKSKLSRKEMVKFFLTIVRLKMRSFLR